MLTDAEWYDHFQFFFNGSRVVDKDETFINQTKDTPNVENDVCYELNKPITEQEVKETVSKLKTGKACGIDEVLAKTVEADRGKNRVISSETV